MAQAQLDEVLEAARVGGETMLFQNDLNDTKCTRCGLPGDMLCCDTCPRVYHLSCLCLSATDVPDGDWSCPSCVRSQGAKASKRRRL